MNGDAQQIIGLQCSPFDITSDLLACELSRMASGFIKLRANGLQRLPNFFGRANHQQKWASQADKRSSL